MLREHMNSNQNLPGSLLTVRQEARTEATLRENGRPILPGKSSSSFFEGRRKFRFLLQGEINGRPSAACGTYMFHGVS